jgi:hypothetical protein
MPLFLDTKRKTGLILILTMQQLVATPVDVGGLMAPVKRDDAGAVVTFIDNHPLPILALPPAGNQPCQSVHVANPQAPPHLLQRAKAKLCFGLTTILEQEVFRDRVYGGSCTSPSALTDQN